MKTPGTTLRAQSESAAKVAFAVRSGSAREKKTAKAHTAARKNFRTFCFFVIIRTPFLIKIDMPAARAISHSGGVIHEKTE
jgi:hypothetical protein